MFLSKSPIHSRSEISDPIWDTGQPHLPENHQGCNPNKSSSPLKSTSNSGKRLSVILSDEAERLLDNLANTQGITKSEALRKAIATESYLTEERMKGSKVFIRSKQNELMEVVFR